MLAILNVAGFISALPYKSEHWQQQTVETSTGFGKQRAACLAGGRAQSGAVGGAQAAGGVFGLYLNVTTSQRIVTVSAPAHSNITVELAMCLQCKRSDINLHKQNFSMDESLLVMNYREPASLAKTTRSSCTLAKILQPACAHHSLTG